MDLLRDAVDMLPDGFPFSAVLQNISRVLASESQGNLTVQSTVLLALFRQQSASWTKGYFLMGEMHSL